MALFSKNLLGFLKHFMRKNYWSFFFMQLFALGWTLDHIAWPQIMSVVIDTLDSYNGPKDGIWNALSHIVILGGFIWIAIEISMRGSGIILARIMPKFEANVRLAMVEYVSRQTHSYFANNYSGSLANKINDMPRSSSSIITMLITVVMPALATILIMSAMFAWLYPMFGALIFFWVMLHIGISLITANKCQDLSNEHAESRSTLAGQIVDSFTNNMIVRIFARRRFEMSLISTSQHDEKKKHVAALMYVEKVKIWLGVFCFLFVGVFMTWLQIYAYKSGFISIGDLIFTFQGSVNVVMVTWWVGHELPRIFQEIGVCQQAFTILQAPIQIQDARDAQAIKVKKGEIRFKDVTFRYERNNNIFNNQNVTIKPGQNVGLVGFSGSGKTTFVNLILRYFDIASGQILIDNQDIATVTQDSLREQIVMIPQEPMMFHRTLMDNIRYGNINATDEEVIEAAKQAHCHEFIMKLKDKYQTIVGERGLKISGGQRQRIAIARAMLKRSPILIMDEATSALDSVTESYIQDSIKSMSEGRTTLIIAHRLSTLADMDRILVFKDGHIVEDGTHEELMSVGKHYKMLWDMQRDGFLPEQESDDEEEGL